jgi:hypothetical protein
MSAVACPALKFENPSDGEAGYQVLIKPGMTRAEASCAVIDAVIARVGREDDERLRAELRAAYPFGERKFRPWRVWRQQIRRILGPAPKRESDLLGEFLDECCIVQATNGELFTYLFFAFQAWCLEREKFPPQRSWSMRKFSIALHMRPNLQRGFIRSAVVWSGVSLRPEWWTKAEIEADKRAPKDGGAS